MTVSLLDIAVVSMLAVRGIFMAPLHPFLVIGLLCGVGVYFVFLDFLKVKMFRGFIGGRNPESVEETRSL
jgi:hypothetical protein